MKILLDHNTPRQLRSFLSEHEVHTAAYMGWSELENGDLLEAAVSHGYNLMVTCAQGISNEQNLSRYAVTLITNHERGLDRDTRECPTHPTDPGNRSAGRTQPGTNDAQGLSDRLTKESPGGRDRGLRLGPLTGVACTNATLPRDTPETKREFRKFLLNNVGLDKVGDSSNNSQWLLRLPRQRSGVSDGMSPSPAKTQARTGVPFHPGLPPNVRDHSIGTS